MSGALAAVQAHVAAFNARDADAVAAGFTDDAVFTAEGELRIGRRAIGAFFAGSFSAPIDATLEIERAVVDGDHVACELVERLAVAGGVHELRVAAFFTVTGGALARVAVYRAGP